VRFAFWVSVAYIIGMDKQQEFSFVDTTTDYSSVKKYQPININQEGTKIWFGYRNKANRPITAYYDTLERSFKSVVRGKQYGKYSAIRNLVARPVVEKMLA